MVRGTSRFQLPQNYPQGVNIAFFCRGFPLQQFRCRVNGCALWMCEDIFETTGLFLARLHTWWLKFSVSVSRTEFPKSQILQTFSATSTFWGFISKCKMPFRCIKSKPLQISTAKFGILSSISKSQSASNVWSCLEFGKYSMIINEKFPSWFWMISSVFTMLLWFMFNTFLSPIVDIFLTTLTATVFS